MFSTWRHMGGRLYAATGVLFIFNPATGQFQGSRKINRTIEPRTGRAVLRDRCESDDVRPVGQRRRDVQRESIRPADAARADSRSTVVTETAIETRGAREPPGRLGRRSHGIPDGGKAPPSGAFRCPESLRHQAAAQRNPARRLRWAPWSASSTDADLSSTTWRLSASANDESQTTSSSSISSESSSCNRKWSWPSGPWRTRPAAKKPSCSARPSPRSHRPPPPGRCRRRRRRHVGRAGGAQPPSGRNWPLHPSVGAAGSRGTWLVDVGRYRLALERSRLGASLDCEADVCVDALEQLAVGRRHRRLPRAVVERAVGAERGRSSLGPSPPKPRIVVWAGTCQAGGPSQGIRASARRAD